MGSIDLASVLELSVDERLRLVEAIWDSIAEHPEAVRLTDAEREVLDERLEAYLKDRAAGSPWGEVKARIRSS